MNGSSSSASPFDSGTKRKKAVQADAKRFGNFFQRFRGWASIWPLSIRDKIRPGKPARARLELALRHPARFAQLPDTLPYILHRLAVRPTSRRSWPVVARKLFAASGGGIRNSTFGRQAASAGTGGNSPCGCDIARARRSCNGLLRGRGPSPWQPCSRLYRSYHSFVSDTGAPRRLFRHADERNYDRGEGKKLGGARHIGGFPASRVKPLSPFDQ